MLRLPLMLLTLAALLPWAAQAQQDPGLIRVAMVAYLFEDQNKNQMLQQMKPFIENMQKDTGAKAEFVILDDLPTLIKEMNEGKVQIAILPSLDFGWLRGDVPTAKPLLVAGVEGGKMKTMVLTAKSSTATSLADLKGKDVSWPKRTPQHVKFFARRELGAAPDQAFKLKEARSVDEAIDEVIDGHAAATLISSGPLSVYQEQKPGRFNRLKVIAESTDFPAPVVAYQTKGADESKIKRFADAMIKANTTAEGQQTLTLWRLKGFEPLPSDYDAQLAAILKKYPKP